RYESAARPLTDRPEHAPKPDSPREEQPSYEMTFTCRACTDRSSHRITKQGYHHGTILITCPGCKNRHLIADHMKIFSDKSMTIEDILKEKGQLLKKGALGSEGDVEFWDDGTQTER
ncbi:DNL zinc finger-domain-containing protein, partial [Delphinella strobiligena]